MKFHHGYSISEQLEMHPFERDIHVHKTVQHLKKLKQAREQET